MKNPVTTIIVKKNGDSFVLSTRNGDYTVDEDTTQALKMLIDDCDWREA